MKSKLIVLALIALIISSASATTIISTVRAQTTTMTMASSITQISPSDIGSTIKVNITVANVVDLWQWWAANLTYDPKILNLTQISEGPFLKGPTNEQTLFPMLSIKDMNNGTIPEISSTKMTLNSESGSGILATMTFKILAVQTTTITFGSTSLGKLDMSIGNTIEIPHTKTNLQITANANTPTPSPLPSINPNATEIPTNNTTASPPHSSSNSPTPTSSTPVTTPSNTPNTNNGNPQSSDLTTVYIIVGVGAVMAVLVALAVFLKKR